MSIFGARFTIFALILSLGYLWWIVSWSFFDQQRMKDIAYAQNRCSFLAGDIDDKIDLCCGVRNEGYWIGGDSDTKKEVDAAFDQCINAMQASGLSVKLTPRAKTMFALRDLVGLPYLHTPWRWAAGWSYGRGFRAL